MSKQNTENQIRQILGVVTDSEPTTDVSDWIAGLDNVQIWDDEPAKPARTPSAIETAALKLLNNDDAESIPYVLSTKPNEFTYSLNYCKTVAQNPSFSVDFGEWAEYFYGVDEEYVESEYSDVEQMVRGLAKCQSQGAVGVRFPATRGEAEYDRHVGDKLVSLANTVALYRRYNDAKWEQYILDGIVRLADERRNVINDGLYENEISFNETNETCNHNYRPNRPTYPQVLAEINETEKK